MKSRNRKTFLKHSLLPPERVFVYGTLKSTHHNRRWMEAARGRIIGSAVTLCRFPLIVPHLPILLPFPGQGLEVSGEVYEVPYRGLRLLDQLEGHPDWYARSKISVVVNGHAMEAWTYFITKNYIPPDWEEREHLSSF